MHVVELFLQCLSLWGFFWGVMLFLSIQSVLSGVVGWIRGDIIVFKRLNSGSEKAVSVQVSTQARAPNDFFLWRSVDI